MDNSPVQQNQGMPQGMPGAVPPSIPPAPKTSRPLGPVVGIVIIIIVLILGGLYLWGKELTKSGQYPQETSTQTTTEDSQVQTLQAQGASDTASSIEADLNATNLNDLDSGLDGSALQ